MRPAEILSGLLAKRQELADQAEALRTSLNELVATMEHMDHTIRLFDPKAAPTARTKPYPAIHTAFKGEMSRMVMRFVREATGPVTSQEIAAKVAEARRLDATDPRVLKMVRERVGACLWKLKSRGILEEVPGVGKFKGWVLTAV